MMIVSPDEYGRLRESVSSVVVWMSPETLASRARSLDWGRPIADTLDAMCAAWAHYLETGSGWYGSPQWNSGEWEPHPAEIAHDGPLNYIDHLTRIFEAEGWAMHEEPIHVTQEGETFFISNGNHRAIAAILAGISIPVRIW